MNFGMIVHQIRILINKLLVMLAGFFWGFFFGGEGGGAMLIHRQVIHWKNHHFK